MSRFANLPSLESSNGSRSSVRSLHERLLTALGFDSDLIEGVVGDLAEEFAERAAAHGRLPARLWYVGEVVRSTPHFLVTAVRRGDARVRLRLAASVTAVTLFASGIAATVRVFDRSPVHLVASVSDPLDGAIVNSTQPTQLPMFVLDRRGHQLRSQPVRYTWISGAPIALSPQGVVTCKEHSNAIVRASLREISTDMVVRCRPVREIRASSWVDFVLGDPPRDLQFTALGFDNRPVTQLRGTVQVLDSAIATLSGTTIRPRSAGQTLAVIEVGDQKAFMSVMVYEPVRSFDRLRPGQRLVAVPVHVARGDTVRWSLPTGAVWIKYLPRRAGEAPPTIELTGSATCTDGDGIRVRRTLLDEYAKYCLVREAGSTVIVAHGVMGASVVEGTLALERVWTN